MAHKTYDDGYTDMSQRLLGVVSPNSFTVESLNGMLKCLDAVRSRIERELRSLMRNQEAHIEATALDIAQELAPEREFYQADVTSMHSYVGDKRVDAGWSIALIVRNCSDYWDIEFDLKPNPTEEDIRAAVKAALEKNP